MNVGAELTRARQSLRLSLEEVSARTKITVERLSAIETMDAERLPSLLYLKGFLRAYAAEVHLDPEDVAERYIAAMDVVGPMDLAPSAFPSEEAPRVVERPHAAVPEFQALAAADPDFFVSEEADHVPPAAESSRLADDGRDFVTPAVPPAALAARRGAPKSVPAGEPRPAAEIPPRVDPPPSPAPELLSRPGSPSPVDSPRRVEAPLAAEPRLRRDSRLNAEPPFPLDATIQPEPDLWRESHGSPLEQPHPVSVRPPRYFTAYVGPDELPQPPPHRASKRYSAMMVALALSVLAGWFIGENYDTIRERVGGIVASEGERDRDDAAASASNDPATAVRGSSQNTPDAAAPPPSGGSPPAFEDSPERSAEPAERAASPSAADRASAPATRTPESAPDAERAVEGDSRLVRANDLSGRWTLTNRIEESSYTPYKGMNVGFQLQLRQAGNRVTGTGQKWMENGRPLPPGRRTPIALEGTVSGGRLTLNFSERGARRTSAGTFSLDVTDENTLSGTFASDAAKAQGTSLARRAESPRR